MNRSQSSFVLFSSRWLRDACYILSAFHNLGHFEEVEGFLKHLLSVAYTLDRSHDRLSQRAGFLQSLSVDLHDARTLAVRALEGATKGGVLRNGPGDGCTCPGGDFVKPLRKNTYGNSWWGMVVRG